MRILKPVLILLVGISLIYFITSLNFSVEDKILMYMGAFLFLMLFLVWAIWRVAKKEEIDLTFESY